MMKKRLFLMMIAAAAVFAGCNTNAGKPQNIYEADDAPPYAASKKVWKFGGLTWSDAIHVPECNNPDDDADEAGHKPRSYTADTNTWYYYGWSYVNYNGNRLCPSPWRIPTRVDASMLSANSSAFYLVKMWGLGGYIETFHDTSNKCEISELQEVCALWIAPDEGNLDAGLVYYYDITGLSQPVSLPGLEMAQLRCVR